MRGVEDLLAEYDESHGHPVNKLLHWICVPLIMFSLLALLWLVPLPVFNGSAPPVMNGAVLLLIAALIYYLLLSARLAAGMLVVSLFMLALVYGLECAGLPLLWISIAVFVLAWIGQFIGHLVEGKRPSFLKDLQFLLIGPLWLLAAACRRLGIRY